MQVLHIGLHVSRFQVVDPLQSEGFGHVCSELPGVGQELFPCQARFGPILSDPGQRLAGE